MVRALFLFLVVIGLSAPLAACEFHDNAYSGEEVAVLSDAEVKEKYGQRCEIIDTCGDIIHVDCMSAADGPAYYIQGEEILMNCGGACMMGAGEPDSKQCEQCPPKEWTCGERT
jgi:hypothetical protein